MPSEPELHHRDQERLAHEPFLFEKARLLDVGGMIGESLRGRLKLRILALAVQVWHLHFVVAASGHVAAIIAKCAKDAVRWGLRPGRPIWTEGFDKRYCFQWDILRARIEYVERHNTEQGLRAQPWDFIEPVSPP